VVGNEVNDLPYNEQGGNIETNYLPELYRCQIEQESIEKQANRPEEHKKKTSLSAMVEYSLSDNGIATHFENGGKNEKDYRVQIEQRLYHGPFVLNANIGIYAVWALVLSKL